MSELHSHTWQAHESYAPFRERATTGSSLAERAVAGAPATDGPALRVVPDLPRLLGEGLLAEETDLDQEVVVRRRIRVTADVVTLVLEPTLPGTFAFRPGQFVTLRADVDGSCVERCYTISSPPTRPHVLSVTVKRMEGGALSPYLHDRLAVGDRLTVAGPRGEFTVTEHPAPRYLLLSAGSGITPTLSTVRALADLGELGRADDATGPGTDVVVVHAARTPADRVCAGELDALAAAHDGLSVVWVCEDDDPGASGAWRGPRGRLDAEVLTAHVPDLAEREILTCGPPGYMSAVRSLLADLGVDPRRCHEESFVLGDAAAPPLPAAADAEPDPPGSGEVAVAPLTSPVPVVRFGRSGLEAACPPGTTVLDAANQAGVFLPSSCSAGMCGTCKSTLLSGKVEMSHQGGIRPREIAQDKFLPCCSTPDGDIVVDA